MRKLAVIFVTVLVFHSKSGSAEDFGYSDIQDLLQIGGDVKITELTKARTAKNLHNSVEDTVEDFFKSNEVSLSTPFDSSVTFNGRGLDNGELDFKFRFNSGTETEARKKSKVKKILAPILVILLLKAITLIPLALGLLGLKTWNALQLAFVSFVTSVVLAVWKLCSKFSDHHHIPTPHIIHEAVHDVHIPHVYHDAHHDSHHDHHVVHHDLHHDDLHHHHDDHYHHDDHHGLWDHHYHRSDDTAQQIVYNGYAPETKL